jgi:enolase-phosphatase E1
MSITHLLLDIEGTTCPVTFVAEVLFPYARKALPAFLASHAEDPEIQDLVGQAEEAWLKDDNPSAVALRSQSDQGDASARVAAYLQNLIDRDVKLTALKDLQGRIWRNGYAQGELVAPLYADVAESLQRWHKAGLVLGVYSSGSVPAQKLLYGHSTAGDLRALFSYWFDTRVGRKQDESSYRSIAEQMKVEPADVLFISDSLSELEAAASAGMAVLFSDREGNPGRDSGAFERIINYHRLHPANGSQRS